MNFKLLLINKILVYTLNTFLVFVLFSGAILASSETNAQKNMSVKDIQIDLNFENDKLTTVFNKIKEQSGLEFIYNKKDLNGHAKFKGAYQNESLYNLLMDISEEFKLQFRQINRNINVQTKLRHTNQKYDVVVVQDVDITGKVSDEKGDGLPGASVVVRGTAQGTTTDLDGNYKLTVPEGAVIAVSFVGYVTQEITVGSQSVIDVAMQLDAEQLEEVVVVGYGTVKKSDLTGAVSSVKADELPLSANTSVEQALISKAAGLTITQNSAQPGGGVSVLIRGAANVGATNAPLYVIDGFPISGGGVEPGAAGGFGNAGFRSPLNDINPNDIESIEVLKDASATAIYGARAANGVILITTKRGQTGAPKVEYSASYSAQRTAKWLDLLNAQEYMTVRNELREAAGDSPIYTDAEISAAGEGTDWFDEITRNGYVHQQNVSVSGGNESTKYLVSFNYFDQQGVMKNSDLTRYTGRFNLDQKISDHVKWGMTVTSSQVNNTNLPLGSGGNETSAPIRAAIDFNPTIPVRDTDGNFSLHEVNLLVQNPVGLLEKTDETVTDRLLANAFVEANIIEGLDARIKVGIDKRTGLRNSFLPTTTVPGKAAGGIGSKSLIRRNDQLFGVTLNYSKTIDEHSFTFLAGYEYQEFNYESFNASNNDFITDGLLFNDLGSGVGTQRVGSFKSFDELASYFGRINYNYKDKYLITASLRRDGSPRFGANNKWGAFPSASFAWRIINEDFMSGIGVLSDLKLRVGYGQTGNSSISGASALFRNSGNYIFGVTEQSSFGVQQTRLANPNLKWQTNTEINVGLDFGLFDGRLTGTFEYFDKEVSDLLSSRQLKTFLPISSIADNIGITSSKGVEVTLSSRNLTGELQWTTDFNLGTYRDRWKERHPDTILPPYLKEKDLIRPWYLLVTDGIQQVDDAIPAHQPNIQPGQVRVKDLNGVDTEGNLTGEPDGQITDADRVFVGSQDPGFVYGIGNNLSYKGFNLSFFFQGMADRLRVNQPRVQYIQRADVVRVEGRNSLREILNRWTPENPNSEIPAGTINSTPGAGNDIFLENAGFLRLRNITLGYTLPKSALGSWIDNAQIYFDVQNAFVITDYTGIDPETDDIGAYPNQRSFTVGLNITL